MLKSATLLFTAALCLAALVPAQRGAAAPPPSQIPCNAWFVGNYPGSGSFDSSNLFVGIEGDSVVWGGILGLYRNDNSPSGTKQGGVQCTINPSHDFTLVLVNSKPQRYMYAWLDPTPVTSEISTSCGFPTLWFPPGAYGFTYLNVNNLANFRDPNLPGMTSCWFQNATVNNVASYLFFQSKYQNAVPSCSTMVSVQYYPSLNGGKAGWKIQSTSSIAVLQQNSANVAYFSMPFTLYVQEQ
jgi:hypothetical protein